MSQALVALFYLAALWRWRTRRRWRPPNSRASAGAAAEDLATRRSFRQAHGP